MKLIKTTQGRCALGVFLVLIFTQSPLFSASRKEQGPAPSEAPKPAQVKLLVAAAASLENAYVQELIPLFQKNNSQITVEGVYDSSGRLQTQIEQGLEADVFMSAATRQMDALVEKNLIAPASVKPLLQNKLVLIKPAGTTTPVTGFENITQARIIALGDPATTPAGQYAQEAFTNLGTWEEVSAKVSLGSNVTEVLNWVGEGSAEVGIVYATDAASTAKVESIQELPEGLLATKVIYPVGMIEASRHQEEARRFINFLASPEALGIFKAFGFSPNN
ncbi:MAG: molybdate ABC transporter substrate-binding protein [Treponema sp.]|jgi:molybdate transport system substrate-binding protein|nr:molybdate ABC transporter substrate-binding protein [Treponema sp.]